MRTVRVDAPDVMSAGTLTGDKVINLEGEDIGSVKEIMLDLEHGRVAYVVLAFGGVMGLGEKLFALPWDSFQLDTDKKAFVLNIAKEKLEKAPGFDKDNWPLTETRKFLEEVYTYYGTERYWD